MGAIAELSETALTVAPGELATTSIRVRNAGDVVDEFTFEAVGDPAAWIRVEPPVLRLMPGVEETAVVTVAPPRSPEARAGEVVFGVKVNSSEDPAGSVVEEGMLTVGQFVDMVAELTPRTSQGRRKAAHELSIDNRGNDLVDARVTAHDDDELLDFRIGTPQLLLQPATAAFTSIEPRPRTRFWRGPEKTLPFRVGVTTEPDEEPLYVDGTMVQRAMIPAWLPKALLALLLLLLLLWLLWATLLKPQLESRIEEVTDEAVDAAVDEALEEPLAEQEAALAAVEEKVSDIATEVADGGGGAVATPTPTPTPSLTPTPTPSPTDTVEEANTDLRLAVAAGPTSSDTDAFTVDADDTFLMTDIILQNPAGNIGTLTIRRGTAPLITVALQNFRDLDYHFVVPVEFNEGQQLVLELDCEEVIDPSTQCGAAAYVTGTTQTLVPAE